jgi:hypothetical protein
VDVRRAALRPLPLGRLLVGNRFRGGIHVAVKFASSAKKNGFNCVSSLMRLYRDATNGQARRLSFAGCNWGMFTIAAALSNRRPCLSADVPADGGCLLGATRMQDDKAMGTRSRRRSSQDNRDGDPCRHAGSGHLGAEEFFSAAASASHRELRCMGNLFCLLVDRPRLRASHQPEAIGSSRCPPG